MGKAGISKRPWRECRKTIKHKWQVPLVFVEWNCERLSGLLSRWAFLEIMEYIGRLAIIVAVIFYCTEAEDRRKARHYQAWQVINAAQGKSGSGGRIDALQDLNSDKISLAGIDLSGAHLRGVDLKRAFLWEADFSEADLTEANLAGTQLIGANLTRVRLTRANLFDATLIDANLTGAMLFNANLVEANLSFANLLNAEFAGAELTKADLSGADVDKASFRVASLFGANLMSVRNWQAIESIEFANVYGVRQAPEGFIEWAKERGAVVVGNHHDWIKLLREELGESKVENKPEVERSTR